MTDSPGPSLRVCILAHQCHQAGGLSVGRNVLRALGRVAPGHQYLVTVPADCGYEDICRTMPACDPWVYPRAEGLVTGERLLQFSPSHSQVSPRSEASTSQPPNSTVRARTSS